MKIRPQATSVTDCERDVGVVFDNTLIFYMNYCINKSIKIIGIIFLKFLIFKIILLFFLMAAIKKTKGIRIIIFPEKEI